MCKDQGLIDITIKVTPIINKSVTKSLCSKFVVYLSLLNGLQKTNRT